MLPTSTFVSNVKLIMYMDFDYIVPKIRSYSYIGKKKFGGRI